MAPGIKTGGRQKGSKNKIKAVSDVIADVVVKAAENGETPLEYMLRIMRDRLEDNERRDEMAKAAAPYVHARLASAKIEHKDVTPEVRSSEELRNEILAELAELGILPTGVIASEEPQGIANRPAKNGGTTH